MSGDSVSILGEGWAGASRQVALLAAVAHLALQWVVHVVVYPGLADQSPLGARPAARLHSRYTSRMAVAVGPVYGLLCLGFAAVLLTEPGWLSVLACALVAGTLALTAAVAVPVHRALSEPQPAQRRDGLHLRLLRVDRLRLALAVVLTLVAALMR